MGTLPASAEHIFDPPQPIFVQQNFLRVPGIEKLTLDFAIAWTDSCAGLFIQPFDAVVLHVNVDGTPHDVFMITDPGMQRLSIWMCTAPDGNGNRTIEVITDYLGDDCGLMKAPSGITTNARNREFDPDNDLIYLADRGNDRILELSYMPDADGGRVHFNRSLGEGVVEWPVDVALCSYGGTEPANTDLYIVDWGHAPDDGELLRFNLGGDLEGAWNYIYHPQSGFPMLPIAKPMAVECFPDTVPDQAAIYVTEAANGNLTHFSATTDGDLVYRMIQDLELGPDFWQPGNVACDDYGRIYICNYAASMIEMYEPFLGWPYEPYGEPGDRQELLTYPSNIVLDTYYGVCEALVFENYTRATGIKTFIIEGGNSFSKRPSGFVGGNLVKPIAKTGHLPLVYSLSGAYPNPFNSECTIRFTMPEKAHVTINVFNVLGQRVAQLINEVRPAGEHTVRFDSKGIGSGTYFYRMNAHSFSRTRMVVLVK